MNLLILDFVVDKNLPISIIQSQSFKTLINTIAGKPIPIPSPAEFLKFITEQYDGMKGEIIKIIEKQNFICTTADVWSSRAQAYLGMTGHYIDDDLKRRSFVLGFRELLGKQTNEVLAVEIAKVFDDYKIPVDKVTHIVTDGGSAFCKAFKVFGKGSDPLVDNIEHAEEDNDENILRFIQFEDGEPFFSNVLQLQAATDDSEATNTFIEDDDNEFDGSNPDQDLDDYFASDTESSSNTLHSNTKLPKQRRCVSHQANLVENDFIKELPSRAATAYMTTFNKLRAIWIFPRRSSYAKAIMKRVLGQALLIPCETRWNSKYDAVRRIFDLKPKINEYIRELKKSITTASILVELSKEDWIVINAYLNVMEPVAKALDQMQNEKSYGQGKHAYLINHVV